MRSILHIDFNSFFATVEQQANPKLRGKPIGVTGGDRMERTVVGAASVEAKRFGVRTGMRLPDALALCPDLILVRGDSDKYLECTKRFLNILKNYSPFLEVFSIDEVFLELSDSGGAKASQNDIIEIAEDIKKQIRAKVGEWITCSIGISYNKVVAKLAGSLYKPDGLVVIADEKAAMRILDRVGLDEICGLGPRIKKRLNNMGIFSFKDLRAVKLEFLRASFKNYGNFLYNIAKGINDTPVLPFYEKEEIKSVGHRHTLSKNTSDATFLQQIFLKLTELIARKLRSKRLLGKTVTVWHRGPDLSGNGMQCTVGFTNDGLTIFKATWQVFLKMWDRGYIRMVGVSVSNLIPASQENLSLLDEKLRQEKIIRALDKINDQYGEFTLQRGILLRSANVRRRPNPFLADYRFKI